MSAPPPGVEADAPLARLTTIGTGGPARFLARPTTAAELEAILGWADAEALDVAVIGLGSNLLVADEGYDGVALHLEGTLAAIEIEGASVRCGGGAVPPSSSSAIATRTSMGLSPRPSSSSSPATVTRFGPACATCNADAARASRARRARSARCSRIRRRGRAPVR